MAAAANQLNWSRMLQQGIIAGIVSGIAIGAFLFITLFLPVHGTIAQMFASDAHNIHQTSALIGALAHFCVSAAWGIGYAYIANTRPAIVTNVWMSGILYGIIVWLAMQLVLMAGGVWQPYPLLAVLLVIVAHTLFFGVPVALTVRALTKPA